MSVGKHPVTGLFLGMPVAWTDPAQHMSVHLDDLPPGEAARLAWLLATTVGPPCLGWEPARGRESLV